MKQCDKSLPFLTLFSLFTFSRVNTSRCPLFCLCFWADSRYGLTSWEEEAKNKQQQPKSKFVHIPPLQLKPLTDIPRSLWFLSPFFFTLRLVGRSKETIQHGEGERPAAAKCARGKKSLDIAAAIWKSFQKVAKISQDFFKPRMK